MEKKSDRLDKLMKFLEATPNDPFILFAIAKEHEKLAAPETAETCYRNLVTQHPDYVGTYYHLGKLLEQKAEIQQALDIYSAGMDVAKKNGDKHAFSELSEAHLNLDD